MDSVHLKAIQHFLLNEAMTVLEEKGQDYANEIDRLQNFVIGAEWIGMGDQTDICFSYMMKQIIAVRTAVRKRELRGESLPNKLRDIINYTILLGANMYETNPEMMVDDDGRRPI